MVDKKITIEKWKSKFEQLGVDTSDFDNIKDWFSKKGYFRYFKLIDYSVREVKLRNFSLEATEEIKMPNCEMIDKLYMADLIIRRELFRIVSPIEINIRTSILATYYPNEGELARKRVETLFIELDEHILKNSKEKDKNRRFTEYKKTILKHLDKSEYIDDEKTKKRVVFFDEFIDNLDFKPLVMVFKILFDLKYKVSEWFDGEVTKFVRENLFNIVYIRNAISHHNILFKNKQLVQKDPSEVMDIVLSCINDLFGPKNTAIKSFQENWSKKYSEHNLNIISVYLEILYKCKLFDPNK